MRRTASAAWIVTGSASRVDGTNDSTIRSVSLSMNTSLMNTSGPLALPFGRVDEMALHVEDELVLRRPGLHARELLVERRFGGRS